MLTPDVTKVQIIALLQAVFGVLVVFGVHLSDAQQTAILGLVGAIAVVLPLADAIIRHGRARALAPTGAAKPAARKKVS